MSWNTSLSFSSRERLDKAVREVRRVSADVVGLQDVRTSWMDRFRSELESSYRHVLEYPFEDLPYGSLVLSKYPVVRGGWRPDCSFFDRFSLAHITVGQRTVDFYCCHIPNGSTHGFEKIRTINALLRRLEEDKMADRIVVGTFNEPKSCTAQTVESWGHRSRKARYSSEEKKAWQRSVQKLFRDDSHGMRDLYLETGGDPSEGTFGPRSTSSLTRPHDHILAGGDFEVSSCEYLHQVRLDKVSNHSAVVAELHFGSAAAAGLDGGVSAGVA